MPPVEAHHSLFWNGPPGEYTLQGDVEFDRLVLPVDKEIVRIRLRREGTKTLDIPLSADSFARLVQATRVFDGLPPNEIAAALQELLGASGAFDGKP